MQCYFNPELNSEKWKPQDDPLIFTVSRPSNGVVTRCPEIKIPEVTLSVDNSGTATNSHLQYDLTEKGIQEIEGMERRRKMSQCHKIACPLKPTKAPVLQISDCESMNRPVRPISPSLMSPPERFTTNDKIRRKSDSAMYTEKDSAIPSVASMRCISSCSSSLVTERPTRSTGFLNGINISFTTKELIDIRERSKLIFYFRTRSHSRTSSKPTSL
eukprot:GHVO01026226.1.p1 GENE.GHVO01026226.1~~GHVO01026226.1.p1  ORF type:complete len:215 (-),score=0.36 GHVO01026226.1:265-909(-)